MTRAATFAGLMLLFPCPWYMVAVGGLLPLPIIVAYGADGGFVLAFSLVHLVVYAWIFHRVAWSIGSFVRHRGISQQAGAVIVTATLLAVSFLPIYGERREPRGGQQAAVHGVGGLSRRVRRRTRSAPLISIQRRDWRRACVRTRNTYR